MKKLIVSLLAVAGLVACSNEDVVRQQAGETIGFSGAFVENATRAKAEDPSIKTTTLDAFRVWAFMDEVSGEVLNDELVSKEGSLWSYANVQYWMPGHTYYFAALAPVDGNWALNTANANTHGAGIVDFINADGSEDLLYAATSVESVLNGNKAVKFQFNHLLSKIKFTFENGFATDNITVDVKNVTMTAPKSGSINLAVENWWDNNEDWVNLPEKNDLTLAFGDVETLKAGASDEAAKERLTIPASAEREYVVNFDAIVYSGNIPTEFHKTATIKGAAFEMGKAYNLKATISPENLDLEAIEFEIEVKEWDQPNDFDLGAIDGDVKVVSTIEELQAALNEGASVVLGADLAGNVTVPEFDGQTISINGNGKKFDGTFAIVGGSTYGEGTTVFNGIDFETAGLNGYDAFIYCNEQNGNTRYPDNVTIKDCTFKGTDTAVAAKFRSLKGNLVVENCKAEGIHSMLQLLSCGEAVVLVDGVEVVDCGRGFSLQNSTNTIRNTNVKAASYGVRLEGGVAATSIENSTIEATQPVIVRKLTTAGYTVNVDADTELKTTKAYQVVFTKGADDAAYVAPEVDFTFNGPADLLVFPLEIVADNAETFAAALKANNENINVVLANDLDVAISSLGQQTGGSGEYKLGGENTKNITIDLNGKKLNITTTYWSNLGAKNDNALFTIKNGTMTSSQPTGTWNSYDLTFSNCNYVIEDVVFEKAIAFANTGKSASLKNVTINETHDYYAMWICAEGMNVTADNLTINSLGRGIKIDEQYSNDAVAKVTLNVKNSTFTTANKAAILVKSVAGAEINVENINIANVAADNKFAVWVDEDAAAHANKVVVNGALVKVEGAKDTVAASSDELATAIQNGAKNVYLENGTYTLASYPAGLEIVGCGDNVTLDVTGKKYGVYGDVAIENIKLVFSDANYTGFQHTNVEVYKNCTIVGQPFLYGNDVTFEGCTFEQDSASAYNVWTYGAKNVKFIDCVFNSVGKSVLIYTESGNGQEVVFEGCTLNASAPADGKAAIEIDSSLISGVYDITINNTTANGFANGNVSGNSLWNNKKGDKTNITVDGVKVL